MTWLALRQQRTTMVGLAVVLGMLGLGLGLLRISFTALPARAGLGYCLSHSGTQACAPRLAMYFNHLGPLLDLPMWAVILPALAGMFVGAPLIAREFDRGTFRLAWTQGVSRGRWLRFQLALALGTPLVVAAIAQAGLNAVVLPMQEIAYWPVSNVMQPGMFDVLGVLPVAYTLFAVALGLASGAVLRRPLPAIILALVLFSAIRITVDAGVRPHLLPPLTARVHVENTSGPIVTPPKVRDALIVGTDFTHRPQGTTVTYTYQPASRFWPLQLLESALYLVLAALLLIVVAWGVLYRRE